jgi:hypothetical protein
MLTFWWTQAPTRSLLENWWTSRGIFKISDDFVNLNVATGERPTSKFPAPEQLNCYRYQSIDSNLGWLRKKIRLDSNYSIQQRHSKMKKDKNKNKNHNNESLYSASKWTRPLGNIGRSFCASTNSLQVNGL